MAEDGGGFGFDRRRLPAKERSVLTITPDDLRVSLLGTVIDNQENNIVLDDGTGKINITFDDDIKAEPGEIIRIFGRVMPHESGFDIQGELMQSMSGLDMELFKRFKSLL